MKSRILSALALAAVLSVVAADAQAGVPTKGVDAEVRGNALVKGTIAEGQQELYRFDAYAGGTLTLVVSTPRRKGATLMVTLLREGQETNEDTTGFERDLGFKYLLRRQPLPETGLYRVTISSDTPVDYSVRIVVGAPRGLNEVVNLGAGGESLAPVSAPPGSRVTLIARPTRGSKAVPKILEFIDGDDVTDISNDGRSSTRIHRISLDPTLVDGDFTIRHANQGTEAGDLNLIARIRAPRVKRQKLDLRDRSLARRDGQETFLARNVGKDGGTVLVDGFQTDLENTAIEIPQNALDAPVLITIASQGDFDLDGDDDQQAGPTIRFGPEGLVFNADATMTLPLDPTKLPVGFDPDAIRVIRKNAKGELEVLTPTDVDVEGGTLTVAVAGFSTFVPTVPKGPPQLAGDWWQVFMEFNPIVDGGGGGDSRSREFVMGISDVSFDGDGSFTSDLDEMVVIVTNNTNGGGQVVGAVNGIPASDSEAGTWSYQPNGQVVELAYGPGDSVQLFANDDGNALVGASVDDEPETALELLLRKPTQAFTKADIAGTYHFAELEVAAFSTGSGPTALDIGRDFGTITFRENGTVLVQTGFLFSFFDGNGAAWQHDRGSDRLNGTFEPQEDGTLLVMLEDDEDEGDGEPEIDISRYYVSADGQVMFGTDDGLCNDCAFLQLAVRQGTRMRTSNFDGEYGSAQVGVIEDQYSVPQTAAPDAIVPDLVFVQETAVLKPVGSNMVRLDDDMIREVRRDVGQPSGVSVVDDVDIIDMNLAVARNGKLTLSDHEVTLVGGLRADGGFGILIMSPGSLEDEHVIGAFVRLPPEQFELGKTK